MKVSVWKAGDYHQLRLLFPNMAIAERFPVYSAQVFSLTDYEFPSNMADRSQLFLLQDKSGFAIDTLGGLCAFLRHIGYMQDSKIGRLERLDLPMTREEAVPVWYREAAGLRVSNLSFHDFDEEGFSFVEFLGKGDYDRLQYCASAGYETALYVILQQLVKYYGRDSAWGAKMFKDVSQALSGFNLSRLKEQYRLTGDSEADLVSLLTFLPPARRKAY